MIRLIARWPNHHSGPYFSHRLKSLRLHCFRNRRIYSSHAAHMSRCVGTLSSSSGRCFSSNAVASGSCGTGLEVRRIWCHEADPEENETVVRVGSFNLLAQHQIEKNLHLYQHCQKEAIDWPQRQDRLMREIVGLSCDILCLQEVQVDHFEEFFKPSLEALDYECHFKKKTRRGFDGCAIVFKRSRFKADHVDLVEYYRPDQRVLRADNVGIVIRLLPLCQSPSVGPLCVANTHLYFNPNRGDTKLAQLTLLLATIDQVARRSDNCEAHHPVIFCGDLNSEPTSYLFDFLASGALDNYSALRRSDISDQNPSSFSSEPTDLLLEPEDLPPPGVNCDSQFIDQKVETGHCSVDGHHLRHFLNLKRVYGNPRIYKYPMTLSQRRSHRFVTSYTAHGVCSVDHMLYTSATLRLLGYRQTVPPEEFVRVGGIPNAFHGSDHIPLLADFALFHDPSDPKI